MLIIELVLHVYVCNSFALDGRILDHRQKRRNIMSLTTKIKTVLPWALSLFIAFIFVQSLFFKYSNAPETQHIFGTLNQWAADSFGFDGLFLAPGIFNQYVIGTAELVASILLLAGLLTRYKILNPLGALMSLGVISGAIFFHLFTPLGIEVQGDGGALFGSAVGIWVASLILVMRGRSDLIGLIKKNS